MRRIYLYKSYLQGLQIIYEHYTFKILLHRRVSKYRHEYIFLHENIMSRT